MTIEEEDYQICGKPTKCQTVWFILSFIVLLISIGLWVAFPFIYKAEVKENLLLKENVDGSYPQSTFYWANPPSDTSMNFYIFNLTNGDEVEFMGEQPKIIEIGPFVIKEIEKKKSIEFINNQTEVYYKNYKTFIFNEEKSCKFCNRQDKIHYPNIILIGALAQLADPSKNIPPIMQSVLSIGIQLIGEFSFIDVSFDDIMFNGYHDNLLTFGNSDLFKFIDNHFGKNGSKLLPFDIPNMKKMGIFYGYNNTNDEDYVIKTGKDNNNEYGKILTWAGSKTLPQNFWSTQSARMINGSDSGSLQHMEIKKSDTLPQFNSYLCRSFDMVYEEDGVIADIPAYKFYVPYDNYDTTLEKNKGFRYANREKINYFPQWPKCNNNVTGNISDDCSKIDCTVGPNLCNSCCNGSFVDGTYLLPPGMYPIGCYPGRAKAPPFLLFFSAPHFYYSPPEVANALYGLKPNKKEHQPIYYYHEPYSGQVLNVNYKFQVNVPIFGYAPTIINTQMPNNIIPIFWASVEDIKKFIDNNLFKNNYLTCAEYAVKETHKYFGSTNTSTKSENFSKQISENMYMFAFEIHRPFGAGLFFAEWTPNKESSLYFVDPTGLRYRYFASTMGWTGAHTNGKFEAITEKVVEEAQSRARAKLDKEN